MSPHYLRRTHKHRVLPTCGENDGSERDACGQQATTLIEFPVIFASDIQPFRLARAEL
jgi:hypothetical protein